MGDGGATYQELSISPTMKDVPIEAFISTWPTDVTREYFESVVNSATIVYGDRARIRKMYSRRITTLRSKKRVLMNISYIADMTQLVAIHNIVLPINSGNDAEVLPPLLKGSFAMREGDFTSFIVAMLEKLVNHGVSLGKVDYMIYRTKGKGSGTTDGDYQKANVSIPLAIKNSVIWDASAIPLSGGITNEVLEQITPGLGLAATLMGYGTEDTAIKGRGANFEYRVGMVVTAFRGSFDPLEGIHGLPANFVDKIRSPWDIGQMSGQVRSISPGHNPEIVPGPLWKFYNRVKDIPMTQRAANGTSSVSLWLNTVVDAGYVMGDVIRGSIAAIIAKTGGAKLWTTTVSTSIWPSDFGRTADDNVVIYRVPEEFMDIVRSNLEVKLIGPDYEGYYYMDGDAITLLTKFLRTIPTTMNLTFDESPLPRWPFTREELANIDINDELFAKMRILTWRDESPFGLEVLVPSERISYPNGKRSLPPRYMSMEQYKQISSIHPLIRPGSRLRTVTRAFRDSKADNPFPIKALRLVGY